MAGGSERGMELSGAPESKEEVMMNILLSMQREMVNMEQRLRAELQASVQETVRVNQLRAEEVLAAVRLEAEERTERRSQQAASMTQSLATGVAGALSEAQRQIQATQQQVEGLGGAVYRATQEAALATYTAERASRMATPPAVTPATPARTGLPAGEPLHEAGAAHAIHELLVWLKDPKSRSAGRIPEVPEGTPYFNGRDPARERVDAAGFIRAMEAYRVLGGAALDISDGMLVLMTTSRFDPRGRAYDWWQDQLLESETRGFRFNSWAEFKALFLEAMRQPDEAITLRLELDNETGGRSGR